MTDRDDRAKKPPRSITAQRRLTLAKAVLFAGTTLGLVAFIVTQLIHVGSGNEYRLTARFENVSGLEEGDQVKIGGVPVGVVDEIGVVKGRARVEMLIENRARVPVDSVAAVRWRNAIGQRVIHLEPGKARQMLADGAEMPKAGKSVVDVGELLNAIQPLTLDRDPGWLNELMKSLSSALDGNEGNVDELMANVETLSGSVAKRKATITQMIKDTKQVTKTIARRDRQIAQMVENLATLSGKFADNRELIDAALTDLTKMTRTSDKLLGKNADDLGALIGDMSKTTAGARRNVKTVKGVMAALGPFLERTDGPLGRGARDGDGRVRVPLYWSCINVTPGPECPYPKGPAKSLKNVVMGD